MNLFLFLLILGNLFIGLGPLFIKFIPGISPFTIGFSRFIVAAIFEFMILIFLWGRIFLTLRKKSMENSPPKLGFLIITSLKSYFFRKNKFFLRGKPQIFYLAFLGFLLVGIVVPFYYLSFQLVGVIMSTIIVNALPILFITVQNWTRRVEEMDGFKLIYLFLLTAGIISITLSYESTSEANLTFFGFLILILTTFAFILYSVYISQDSLYRVQLIPTSKISKDISQEIRKDLGLIRSFYKLFGIHLLGSLIFLILMLIIGITDHSTVAGTEAHRFIFEDLKKLPNFLINPAILSIAVFCTLIPYMIQVFASGNWPKHELGFDSWNSVLTVLQPLVGLYIGIFIWLEPISLNYVIITSIFLIISIIIRYLHESANYRLILFQIRIKNSEIEPFLKYVHGFREISEVYLTFGRVGIIFHAAFRSVARLFMITKKIETFPGVISVKYYPEIEYTSANREEEE
ncbi:MAG: hypothetical protein DRO88_02995 [Promethearchaeia archaeon]|nr:MAG: hypothetical protein DRO88_02995 [Candidatus Lokiarchaeia archaeon]